MTDERERIARTIDHFRIALQGNDRSEKNYHIRAVLQRLPTRRETN